MAKAGMQIRPIRTEQAYDEALARIDQLMSAKAGSPEGDELDALVTLVDAYEAKHFPMDPALSSDGHPVPDGAAEADVKGSGADRLAPEMRSRVRDGLGISADVLVGTGKSSGRKR